jgi:hypothetical protein
MGAKTTGDKGFNIVFRKTKTVELVYMLTLTAALQV